MLSQAKDDTRIAEDSQPQPLIVTQQSYKFFGGISELGYLASPNPKPKYM